jgi:hypothetical protein
VSAELSFELVPGDGVDVCMGIAKWSRALALLLRKEGWGILKSLILEVFEERLRHNISYREVNTYNQLINATNM